MNDLHWISVFFDLHPRNMRNKTNIKYFVSHFLYLICQNKQKLQTMFFISNTCLERIYTLVYVKLDNRFDIWNLNDCDEDRDHNQLVCKRTFNHSAKLSKWLSVSLRTNWFWVRVQLQKFYNFSKLSRLSKCSVSRKSIQKFLFKTDSPKNNEQSFS